MKINLFGLLVLIQLLDWASSQIYWEKLFDSLSYESNIRPVPRRDAAVGYDIGRNRIVVFGGWQTNTDNFHYRIPVLLDDTWEFDLTTRILFSQCCPPGFETNSNKFKYLR